MTSPDEISALLGNFLRSLPADCGCLIILETESGFATVQGIRADAHAAADTLAEYLKHLDEEGR